MAYILRLKYLSGLVLLVFLSLALSADAQTTGGIILRWTAPGDDGYAGTAAGYEIRYQPFASGSLNTETEWQNASSVPNMTYPSPAGHIDSVMVLGLSIGSAYYFALRAFDEAANYSGLSNSPLIVAVAIDCCSGTVGDINGRDGDAPTISDISMLIDHVFVSNRPIWCAAEADINLSGGANPKQAPGGDITISDITILIDHLFITGRSLPNCY